MPPRKSSQLRAGPYFLSLLALLGILYVLVFFTGNSTAPKLGLDLRGGTTVTLQAQTPNGKAPSHDALNTAKNIINQRVNGLGVAGSEVVTEGNDRIVISVPGDNGQQAKSLGTTAKLYFRPALTTTPLQPVAPATPTATPTKSGSTTKPSSSASSKPAANPTPTKSTSPTKPSTSKTPAKQHFAPTKSAAPKTSAPKSSAPSSAKASTAPTASPSADTTGIPAALQKYAGKTCKQLQTINAAKPPTEPILACTQDGKERWPLAPSIIPGTEVKSASAQFGNGGQSLSGWVVLVDLKGSGQTTWAKYTAKHNAQSTPGQAANYVGYAIDGELVSSPSQIQETINGTTQISGGFNQTEAKNLANNLKYGALPLSFKIGDAETVSPTLGSNYLRGGLIAGGIGLGLVVIYSLLYYRALGLVTIASLAISGVLVYACIVLLGQHLSFSLSLAGIAGFIVAVGITADSFVVLFERLKEEVHQGRSMRSGVPRAWVRARRTILTADAVSFMAAAILYYLAAGDVRGFAFTLGLSTILDLVVVFLFTHPLLSVLSRNKHFASPRLSGLRPSTRHQARVALAGTAPPLSAAERAARRRAGQRAEGEV